jgi:hypothetical protein
MESSDRASDGRLGQSAMEKGLPARATPAR